MKLLKRVMNIIGNILGFLLLFTGIYALFTDDIMVGISIILLSIPFLSMFRNILVDIDISKNIRKIIYTVIVAISIIIMPTTDGLNETNNFLINIILDNSKPQFKGYTMIEVDGGDLSGNRLSNVVVDVGYGKREYWAFTNEYGQLVKVIADKIIPQDELKEKVDNEGRYYSDEAKVPGTEREDMDEGHVIADSLGGVSNAYNITPQNSILNRYGDQAYMEKVIRDAGGCSDFVAIITYPDTKTQIPSHYSFTYTLMGNVIHDEFDNVSPE